MDSSVALVAYAIGIAGLFILDRDTSERPSKALWLPVIWLWINGSRPLSFWLGMSMPREIPGQLPPTSLLDQLVAATLMFLGVIVVLRRRREAISLLRTCWPIVFYFSICLLSLLWSDFPVWGFKRWIRALGDLLMVLVVATDAQPTKAFGRLLSRVGFVLLPASVLLIKYYPNLGTGYDEWGHQMRTGVTTNKNMLGVLAYPIALGVLWHVLSLFHDKKQPARKRRLLAQCVLLCFAVSVLNIADSATSLACFVLGAGLMLLTRLRLIRRIPAAVHALVLTILLSGGLLALLGGQAQALNAMGRKADLTGRTEIWPILIAAAPDPILGAGFETFWVGPRVAYLASVIPGGANEAHNGYIEIYLNLGWVGIGLIALILLQGYRTTARAFRRDPALGGLLVAYVVTAAVYNITEAGFRMLDPLWFFLLLSLVAASRLRHAGDGSLRSRQGLPTAAPTVVESDAPDSNVA